LFKKKKIRDRRKVVVDVISCVYSYQSWWSRLNFNDSGSAALIRETMWRDLTFENCQLSITTSHLP